MAQKLVNESSIVSIANAIRSKGNTTSSLVFPNGFVSAINSIPTEGGGGTPIETIFEAEMTDTVSKVNTLTSGKNCYVFTLIADTHAKEGTTGNRVFTEATMPNIKRLCELTHVDAVVHLGDLIDGSETKDVSVKRIKDLRGLMMKCGTKWRIHDGNHDHNGFQGSETSTSATTEFITTPEMSQMLAKHVDTYGVENKMYFYEDVPELDLRIIHVSSNYMDNVGGGYGTAWGYPSEELTWIRETALDTTYSVIFFSHMGLVGADSQYGTQQKNGVELKAIVDNFCNNGGTVIAWINGHNHWDRIKEYDNFKAVSINGNGVWNKTHTSDIPSTVTDAQRWDRSLTDYTKDCFDVAIVNMDDLIVNFVRFGAGVDRELSFAKAIVPLTILTQPQSGTVAEGSSASVSVTVNKQNCTYYWEAYTSAWVDASLLGAQGQGTNVLSINNVTMQANGVKLRCTITDRDSQTVVSNEATVTVTPRQSYTNVLDTVGYTDGKYMSGNDVGNDANYTATGYIPFTTSDVIYIKGNPGWANESHCRMTTYSSSKSALQQLHSYTTITQYFTLTTLGTNYVKLEPKTSGSYVLNSSTAFARMSLKGIGADLIVTLNEPIE